MLNILICDDDNFTINKISFLLKQFLDRRQTQYSVFTSTNSEEIYNTDEIFDIAYIDIEMPQINGLTLSKKIKQNNPNVLIMIVTSFENYLDDAMDIHVYRYLSKPIDKTRFFTNLESALKQYHKFSHEIIITNSTQTIRITTSDIVYITVSGHKSMICTKDSQYYSDRPVKEWLKKINEPQNFALSHSSYFINLKYVINFDKSNVIVKLNHNKTEILPMSQRKYISFKKSFLEYMEDSA